jgi:3-oxoacyl-[acyl-carrier protein] reductase
MPSYPEGSLSDKVAIVTGGARNIGRAICHALAAAGATVVVNTRADTEGMNEVVNGIANAGGKALGFQADVTREAEVTAMVQATRDAFGAVDILVHNAGLRRRRAFTELSLDEWHQVLGVNLDGAFLCARACVGPMLAAGGGRIIALGGVSGHAGAAERAHVVASKAGLVGLIKALAVEFGDRGITANLVVPATIDTVRGAAAGTAPVLPGGASLVGRLGQPEEIAAAVLYLCLPEAGYVTGQTLHVNGGRYLP